MKTYRIVLVLQENLKGERTELIYLDRKTWYGWKRMKDYEHGPIDFKTVEEAERFAKNGEWYNSNGVATIKEFTV